MYNICYTLKCFNQLTQKIIIESNYNNYEMFLEYANYISKCKLLKDGINHIHCIC